MKKEEDTTNQLLDIFTWGCIILGLLVWLPLIYVGIIFQLMRIVRCFK